MMKTVAAKDAGFKERETEAPGHPKLPPCVKPAPPRPRAVLSLPGHFPK